MNQKNDLTEILGIRYPIIMAPMFLVSNVDMVVAADKAGISGCIPALNYRTIDELKAAIVELKQNCRYAFGFNLIVNKSNIYYQKQLDVLVDLKVDYIITSLGKPDEVIKRCRPQNIKVFCDVVDADMAKKVEDLGADAAIAVNSGAGGHAGKIPATLLIPMIKEKTNIPVISAGGVGTRQGLQSVMDLGACGASVGSLFIATYESAVSTDYKEACVKYGARDIVMTTKLSGTPCTVIQTPYVEKIGTSMNPLEAVLNHNKRLKKYAKMITGYKGLKALEKAAFGATYKKVWCAGPSIEFVSQVRPVAQVVDQLIGPQSESIC